MILHTIINEADVWADNSNVILPNEFVSIDGGLIECRQYNGERQVVRLHSTNPYLYLKNEYSPYSSYK